MAVPEGSAHKSRDSKKWTEAIAELNRRALPQGGFARSPGERLDVPSTAWAILALLVSGAPRELLTKAADRLVELQQPDGRLPVDARFRDAYWPTSLLVLVSSALPGFEKPGQKAVECLLKFSGVHWVKGPEEPQGHDTNIPGWGWANFSHSWVEPTALAIIALKLRGLGDHERAKQGIALLLNRQLASGGWNYGNTSVYGRPQFPTPESTGHALCALEGSVPFDRVATSLAYLTDEVRTIRTPLSLAWGVLALSAWGNRPSEAEDWIDRSLTLQSRYGPYETSLLAQLVIAGSAPRGLIELLRRGWSS